MSDNIIELTSEKENGSVNNENSTENSTAENVTEKNGKTEVKKQKAKKEKSEVKTIKELTPSEIVGELDKYIIGQNNAKKSVAIALRNRWRRKQIQDGLREEIMPNNIILIGPTGVGKTEIARRLAKLSNAPFIKVEASKFTEVGYVGRDVESIVRELTDLGVTMVKSEKSAEVQKKAEYHAEERILDILIPPVKKKHDEANANQATLGFTAAATPEADKEENFKTREKFREKLNNGELDEKMIEVDITADGQMMQVMGPIGLDDLGVNLQDLFSSVMPKKMKKRKMSVREARVILVQEEANKLIDMDSVVKEAINRVQEYGIVFIDEIDKIAGNQGKGGQGPDVSREGVQRDLLPIVEGSIVTTKYGTVRTDHVLFIASGAFHVSKPSDLIPELQGRFPIRVELNSLSEEDFVKILTQPQNALLKQYEALLKAEGVKLTFEEDGIKEIARIAAEVNEQVENIGARRLHTILSTLLEEILFNTPDKIKDKNLTISHEVVQDKLKDIVKNRDLSRYIL